MPFLAAAAFAQPVSLRSDIQVSEVMNIQPNAARCALDPATGNLTYITANGDVYQINYTSAGPSETRLHTSADHGITFLQGMAFNGLDLYLVGNNMIDSTSTIAYLKRGTLVAPGLRQWTTVFVTDIYPQSRSWYDHGFSGITITPDGSAILVSSGSRTDHGEEQNNYGMYPGMREVPLTSGLFRIPINTNNLHLQNNDAMLEPYLYADGLRNTFDLAFHPNGDLFGVENSGDRDDPDELNWLRPWHHYGFPWMMGDGYVPQQFAGYDPNNDACINHECNAWKKGYFHDDPNFPPSTGMIFTRPVRNLGPDADKFRDTITGQVKDASDLGVSLGTFTPHRSPLGLVFDKNNQVGGGLTGEGFVLSFTKGGDATGLTPAGALGTIDDPSQDLLHLNLSKDASGQNYNANVSTLVKGFSDPVDAEIVGNVIYVIGYGDSGPGKLWKVTMPPVGVNDVQSQTMNCSVYPNPCSSAFELRYSLRSAATVKLTIYDLLGNRAKLSTFEGRSGGNHTHAIDVSQLSPGAYSYCLESDEGVWMGKLIVTR